MEKDNSSLHGAEKKEAFFQEAESKVHSFSFQPPPVEFATQKKKVHIKLAGTNSCRASIQILNKGGENNLHYHPNMDLIYMVLKGRIRFYGPENKLLGDYGPNEGILLPENARYWFESAGDEETWLLQIAGFPKGVNAYKRIALEAPKQTDGGEGAWFSLSTGEMMTDSEHKQREMREVAK